MSIPGLGQIPTQPVLSTSRPVTLNPAWEWRFEVPHGATLVVKLLNGTAEKDGVELALRNAYVFSGTRSKILTWHGCELEVSGRSDDDFVADYANPAANPATSHVNLHAWLEEMRAAAAREQREGPRVLVVGGPNTGKTTLARTLVSYATRQGHQVIAVSVDPREGMLSLPGTLSAGVFATVMDPVALGGWGSTPTSGPSTVPVKLPLVYNFGRREAEEDVEGYRELVGRLAGAVSGRLSDDEEVRCSGVVVDSMGVGDKDRVGMELLAHVVDEFSINVVVVIGSKRMHGELTKRLGNDKTSLGEPISVIPVERSEGVVDRDETFARRLREAVIKEYFFGDARRSLSPQIQQVDFDSILIYKLSEHDSGLVVEQPSSVMEHWTLAVMHASLKDTPEDVRVAGVMGFVYVADVDEERRKMKILAPVGGRLGDRPLVWGKWPEPYINLLG